MKKYFYLVLALLLLGCEDDALNNYATARHCLNNATNLNAQACVAPLAGDDSPRANKLKCAAGFIAEGMDNSRLAQIFSEVQGSSKGEFTTFSKALVFSGTSGTNAIEKAQATSNFCQKSNSVGMLMFGSMAYTATLVAVSAGYAGDYENTIDGIDFVNDSTGAYDASLGNNILAIKNSYCNNPTSQDSLCTQVNEIITAAGSTDPTAIGVALRAHFE